MFGILAERWSEPYRSIVLGAMRRRTLEEGRMTEHLGEQWAVH